MKFSAKKPYKVYAVVMACFFRDEYARQLWILNEEAKRRNAKLIIFSSLDELLINSSYSSSDRSIFSLVPLERFDGVILFSDSYKDDNELQRFVAAANEKNVRIITVDKPVGNAYAHIVHDYNQVFREICEHMIGKHKFKNIYFMGGTRDASFAIERLNIFKDVMKKHHRKVSEDQLYYGGFWSKPCKVEMERMFREIENGKPMPDAIICANDYMCFTVIDMLEEHGLRVPDDVAISGLDGLESERFCSPRLTTGVMDYVISSEKIFNLLEDPDDKPKGNVVLPSKIQIGQSCGCHGVVPESTGTSVVNLKTNIRQHVNYEEEISILGTISDDDPDFTLELKEIPRFLDNLSYLSFTFAANLTYLDEVSISVDSENYPKDKSGIFTKKMAVWEVDRIKNTCSDSFEKTVKFGDIVPKLYEKLERDPVMLVIPVHAKKQTVGYTVMTLNPNKFWITGYSTFLVSFNHMLEMLRTQFMLTRTYMVDSLTGLLTRNGFYKNIDTNMIACSEKELSVISIDMDNLKHINDTYGHSEGDAALKKIGSFIKKAINKETAARIGGDEFLIAFIDDDTKLRTAQIINSIHEQIRDHNMHKRTEYLLEASIGVYANTIRSRSFDFFLKRADDLMYQQKEEHKSINGSYR